MESIYWRHGSLSSQKTSRKQCPSHRPQTPRSLNRQKLSPFGFEEADDSLKRRVQRPLLALLHEQRQEPLLERLHFQDQRAQSLHAGRTCGVHTLTYQLLCCYIYWRLWKITIVGIVEQTGWSKVHLCRVKRSQWHLFRRFGTTLSQRR